MKIQESLVRKIVIRDIPYLGSISVFLEDFEKGEGNITINCDGDSWSHYWGSMGSDLISFIDRASVGYIAGKLDSIDKTITDTDKLVDNAKASLLRMRRNTEIKKDDVRDLWDNLECVFDGEELLSDSDLMYKIYGDEWWCGLPRKPNPHYDHLCKIVSSVKEGLLLYKKEKELV